MTSPNATVEHSHGDADPRFPLAPAQRPFWFAECARPGAVENNISVRWEIRGPIRGDQIEAAFRAVIERHQILRTRFLDQDGTPVQEVVQDTPFRLSILDIRNLPRASQEARVGQIETELGAEGFDLATPCPMRVALVQLAADRAALLIVAHHIVFDGFSIRVLGEEIGGYLAAEAEGTDWTPPDIEVQYGDYALWREACGDSPQNGEDSAYWRAQLRDAPYFEYPADRPRGPARAPRGARLARRFGPDFGQRLEAAARRHGVSPFTIGAVAVSAALHRLTGAPEILLGTPVAGREEPELEALIGVFVNTVVLRFGIDPDARLDGLIAAAGRTVADALSHQGLPFDEAVRIAGQRRDPARTPLVSVLFGLQRVFLQEGRHGPFEMISVPSQAPGQVYDLDIQIFGRNSGWSLVIDYDAEIYQPETLETLAATIAAALDAVLGAADRTVQSIPAGPRAAASVRAATHDAEVAVDGGLISAIAAIWSELLGLPESACNGDFFELGGHSVLVLRMLARVEREFGVRPGIGDFFAAPTLAGFAATVARHLDAPARITPEDGVWKIITLRDGPTTGPVLVSLNQPFLYHNVARALASDMPVINLHIAAPDALEGPGALSFDAVIDAAADRVRGAYAGRPLFLTGQCVDGRVALRLARRLADAGHPVAGVAMIDSWAPDSAKNTPAALRRYRALAGKVARWAHYLGRGLRGEARWTEIVAKTRAGGRLLRRFGRAAEPVTETERLARLANLRLMEASRDDGYDAYAGEVMLFASESQPVRGFRTLFGWKDRVPADTPIYPVEGWHEDALLEDGYRRIAEVIDARFAHRR